MAHGGPSSQANRWHQSRLDYNGRMLDKISNYKNPSNPRVKPLAGMKIVVTAIDLEQAEHRGIAVYSKGLLKAVKDAGAEVWLLTGYNPKLMEAELKLLPRNTQELIYASRVLECLVSGQMELNRSSLKRILIQKLPFGRWSLNKIDNIRQKLKGINPKQRYTSNEISKLYIHSLVDNPYLQHERLSYLKWIDGILCAEDIYVNSMKLAGKLFSKPLYLNLEGYDGFITTCPLNIKPDRVKFSIQSVHDLIPLEYYPTSDRQSIFAQRLQHSANSARIFVSTSTKNKFNRYIKSGLCGTETVVVQPPSIKFNNSKIEQSRDLLALYPCSGLNKEKSKLTPFRYILFNSSVESRKNLVFALKAYKESRLAEKEIKFCITGALKSDEYSRKIENLVLNDDSIILTNYIDDATKRDLFLNAMLLVSPSLVEGFGIPVLDAACLGLVALASPSMAHREIQNLYDFDKYVWFCDNHNSSELAKGMYLAAKREAGPKLIKSKVETANAKLSRLSNLNKNQIRRMKRIERYETHQKLINQEFQDNIVEIIAEELECNPNSTRSKKVTSLFPGLTRQELSKAQSH